MPQSIRLTTRRERDALRSIKRICYSGADSISLRARVAELASAVVPVEACGFATTDPDTGLFTHGWIDGIPAGFLREYMATSYLDGVIDLLDLAASGRTATAELPDWYRAQLRRSGLERGAHGVFCSDGEMWGAWCGYRDVGSRPFQERELCFMRTIAPHVGYGLRFAATRAAAAEGEAEGEGQSPGVLVLDARGRVALRSGPAASQLADLVSVGAPAPDPPPYAVLSVLTRLRAATAAAMESPRAELRAQGRSGRWYCLRAALSEPDGSGACAAVIVIEPALPRPSTSAMLDRYQLSPREREVLLLVIQGESTKRIAGRLGLSPYTVQDHLDHGCGKVGVRGRKALLARFLAERCAAVPPA